MRLILVRHGNTFVPDEKAVWLGPMEDLPLVASGMNQAVTLGKSLTRSELVPVAIFCGPLLRMTTFAQILQNMVGLGLSPVTDDRLTEIGYGAWTGLSNEEVIEKFGEREFYNWYHRNIWPRRSSWTPRMQDFRAGVADFLRHLAEVYKANQLVVAVTSHGVLKCLGAMFGACAQQRDSGGWCRVDTGHVCDMAIQKGQILVRSWNTAPGTIRKELDPGTLACASLTDINTRGRTLESD